ncbi:MAG: hypothetical protein BGO89_11730 [Candidatus Kapaibacterium thiocyanatum]|uniref:Uncharacterized protein n=1 Tax=Candidatus Kapaibacterium thiocyanatum TaxID=1895771 RepID=A0A1M3KXQ9_9BACT|nr:MAG: hypothetical protein BGO89_11730 ['Candidatus Kapabacteria' thiocyanatum]
MATEVEQASVVVDAGQNFSLQYVTSTWRYWPSKQMVILVTICGKVQIQSAWALASAPGTMEPMRTNSIQMSTRRRIDSDIETSMKRMVLS